MSMNKKKNYLVLFVISLFLSSTVVLADNTSNVNSTTNTGIKCSELSTDDCKKSQECELVGGTCTDSQVAEAPCDDNNIRKVLKIFGAVLTVAKFFVPLLIIGFGSFDLYKSVIDKDEKSLSKQLKMIIMRVIAGMVVFFLPDLIYFVFNSLDDNINNNGYKTCAECVLKPSANDLCTISDASETYSSNNTASNSKKKAITKSNTNYSGGGTGGGSR